MVGSALYSLVGLNVPRTYISTSDNISYQSIVENETTDYYRTKLSPSANHTVLVIFGETS